MNPTDTPEIRQVIGLQLRERQTADGRTVCVMTGEIRYDLESVVMRDWFGDQFVEVIASGAFDQSLKERAVKCLWSHRTDMVLGNTGASTLRLTVTKEAIGFENDLPDTSAGRDARESIQRGDVDGVSFGMKVRKDKWSVEDRDGKKLYKRTILDAELHEISPVAFPAYPENTVSVRSLDEFRQGLKQAQEHLTKRKLTLELELLG